LLGRIVIAVTVFLYVWLYDQYMVIDKSISIMFRRYIEPESNTAGLSGVAVS
jgi:hypothetical protein